VSFYTAEEGIGDWDNRWFVVYFGNGRPQYKISECRDRRYGDFTTTPSLTLDDTWTITKTETGLTFKLNGDEVLNEIFSSSGYNCVNTFNVEVTRILFHSTSDTASHLYREGTAVEEVQNQLSPKVDFQPL